MMTELDETRIAELLAALPAVPEAWLAAAKELPFARPALDDLVAQAELDVAFRDAVLADLEKALADAGQEPTPMLVAELRRRLSFEQ
jgi:hypothetical protein